MSHSSKRGIHLSPKRQALLDKMVQSEGLGSPAIGMISVREDRRSAPLSYGQQRLWFIDELEPGNPTYNDHFALSLTGKVNVAALAQALNEIVNRHEALRTTFYPVAQEPLQFVSPAPNLAMQVVNVSGLAKSAPNDMVVELAATEGRRPFNLRHLPLIRVTLVRLADEEQVLLMTVHHIVSDGWSTGIMIREVTQLYEAWRAGEPSPLQGLRIQYSDYAVWQREWLQGEVLAEQQEYWNRQLAGMPVLELPTDGPRPPVASYRGAREEFSLSAELTDKLKEVSRRQGATLFMTLLAGFQILLARYSGQVDIPVGTTIAGRNRAETEGLIGFFVNTLVMRVDLSGNPTVRELLGRVRETVLEVYAHQELPLEKLVEELQPQRSLSHQPLFQVMFSLQESPLSALNLPGLKFQQMKIDRGYTKFDLSLMAITEAEAINWTFEYATDLFEVSRVRRMGEHLRQVLAEMSGGEEQRVMELPLLTAPEQQQLLVEWNDTQSEFGEDLCLHQLFEEQVKRRPEAVAVVSEQQHLSYAELNRRANQLAHYLVRLGIGPDVRVGLCLGRGPEVIMALLGVLKAGGAYVPLDPALPAAQLELRVRDAGAEALITLRQTVAGPRPPAARAVWLDQVWPAICAESGEDFGLELLSDHLAYVIYTSGSTGQPKGVCCPHRGVVNLLRDFERRQPLRDAARGSWWTDPGFDVSVYEIFSPLLCGGTLHPVPELARALSSDFFTWLERHQIHSTYIPPHMLYDFAARLEGGKGPPLRRLLVGVEPIPEPVLAAIGGRVPGLKVINGYGPTEASICATLYEVAGRGGRQWQTPMGRPVRNTTVYLLDAHLQCVPLGARGEVYLGGQGLARGYLDSPMGTAERYIADPYSGQAGARLYRTGDIGRHLASGEVEFLGRVDRQVKLRGYRIELGEVEEALRGLGGVVAAVAVVREDTPGNKCLVAYVITREGSGVSTGDWRGCLRSKLPEYMVPSALVELAEWPLTATGKVDRKALPAPVVSETAEGSERPRTAVEEIVAGIWCEVLRLERVGINDNFFDLGGHSLLATQMISRVREVLGVEAPLRVLFENPTVARLAEAVERERGTGRRVAPPPILPVSRDGELPLSYAQQRLWLIQQLEPENATYNIPLVVRLRGAINIVLLEQSLGEIARRHEALRTRFVTRDGRPAQVIDGPGKVSVAVWEISEVAGSGREKQARGIARQEARRPFDLGRGPVWRAALARLGVDDHVLLLSMHHVASDGWSIGLIVKEFTSLYEWYRQGQSAALPELPAQYADFALWQREWLQGEVLQQQLEYWRRQLAGAPPLELPTDSARPAVASHRGAQVSFVLSSELTGQLNALSRREGATLFMTLLAGLQTVLGRAAGQEDVAIGTPIANRNRLETEGLIGFFVNQLVLRTDLSGNPSFSELLGRVRETTLDAYTHQDLPFEMLVNELAPGRDLSRSPLFQVELVLQNTPQEELRVARVDINEFDVDYELTKFDLTLTFTEELGGVRGMVGYATDLYDRTSIERLLRRLRQALEVMVADAQERILEIALLTAAERQQVLREWNDTECDENEPRCVHELFERQVARTPDAIAVIYESEQLSYGELNQRSNQLAHYLRGLGVEAEVQVTIFLARSLEMVTGVLGVLKAGGAYVPLDLNSPVQRLAALMDDLQPTVLLTQASLRDHLAPNCVQVVCLDKDWEQIGCQRLENLAPLVGAGNLAYTIYTSGSTGQPKGVMNSHGAVSNHLLWRQARYPLSSQDSFLHKASLSFDISVWEICGTLVAGARLVLARRGSEGDSHDLVKMVKEYQISVMHFGPAMLQAFLAEGVKGCRTLRQVYCGGELLTSGLQARYFSDLDAELHHQYGPTETSIDVTVWDCERESERSAIPIGRPVWNTQIYALDQKMEPVAVGVTGELWIGGFGLARGYLNRPELTAEKFRPDALSNQRGNRLYRTGDLARLRADGAIEFIGRSDHQVKVRGYRIELGEIETVLGSCPGVQQVAVVIRGDNSTDRRLIAYMVPSGDKVPSGAELREYLRRSLPDYMVPSAYVELAELPLTPNGKLDRKSLPAPEAAVAFMEGEGPRTAIEEIVAGIWREILQLERVSVRQNFFELGGHSLLATQVMSRVREALEVDIPLRVLFERPTVEGLASAVERERMVGSRVEAPPILPISRDCELPLSFAQQRLWFIDQLEPGGAMYNIPTALRVRGELRREQLERVLSEVVRRHETLRTKFVAGEGQLAQVIDDAKPVAMPIIDLSGLDERQRSVEADRIVKEEANKGFDLRQGPLLRTGFLKLTAQEQIVLLTMHHVASDGWSMRVLIREFSTLYDAYNHGAPSTLPELPIQYADYAVWQRQWLQGETLERQLAYWRKQLEGIEALDLPTDFPRPAVQNYRGGRESLSVNQELTLALREFSQREGVTMFMLLLGALQALLSRYTGQQEIAVGTPIAGRNRAEIENLIGFFVNTLVMKGDLVGDPTFREYLSRVRGTALGAYGHQEIPFEKLVEELRPQRDLSRSPLFQVWFNLHGFGEEDLGSGLSDLSIESFSTGKHWAMFDLSLYAMENRNGVQCSMVYNRDLFGRETVSGLLRHFRTLLEEIAANPDRGLRDLPLMREEEREAIIAQAKLNGPSNPFIEFRREEIEQSIAERFERQVKRCGHRLAVKTRRYEWSYRELGARTGRIARQLVGRRGEREERVALLFEQDAPMIAGMLGALRAGKTYVPVDAALPRERIAYLLKDARVSVILSDGANLKLAEEMSRGELEVIDIEAMDSGECGNEPVAPRVGPDRLAYLLYTSGSTGEPKGVVQSHRNVLHFIRVYTNSLHINEEDRLSLMSSPSFDAAVMDIFGALLNGASLYPINLKEEEPREVCEWLVGEGITIYHSTPTVYRYLLSEVREEMEFGAIRLVVLGGEEASRRDVELYKRHFGEGCVFINGLGPTESTVTLQYKIGKETEVKGRTVPVGYPVEETEIILLNDRGEGGWLSGEIGIISDYLALGYWEKPELTKHAFVKGGVSGRQRIYRTGDLGRVLSDGSLEYRGRKDGQVKIRGYRIEAGEVESVLCEAAGVNEAAVVASGEGEGEKRLVAYVVMKAGEEERVKELRGYLKERLPEYMVPTAYVKLERLPLTPNGKLDHRALPEPEISEAELLKSYVAPRTPVEEELALIWQELLREEKVGIYDNFFERGGHSLLLTQLVSRIRKVFDTEVPLRALFDTPTIVGMSKAIVARQINSVDRRRVEEMVSQLKQLSPREISALLTEQ